MFDANAAHRVVHMIRKIGHRDFLWLGVGLQERRYRGDLHDAADVFQHVELPVIHVARMVAQRADAGMGGDDRGARQLGSLQHGVAGDMGDIDQHAEPVQFADRGPADLA
jgi:hypothetical protein